MEKYNFQQQSKLKSNTAHNIAYLDTLLMSPINKKVTKTSEGIRNRDHFASVSTHI